MSAERQDPIGAVVFDKDGTLVDFHRTWDRAIARGLRAATDDDEVLAEAAAVLEFDLATDTIRTGSPPIAESNDVIHALIAPILDADRLLSAAFAASIETVAPAVGLPGALHDLRERGVVLAVATNDYEPVVAEQLAVLGWADLFAEWVGADSGYGGKPGPGMILGVLERIGVPAAQAVMVGDTAHDLLAGSRAGAATVLVTNGTDPSHDLCELADHVVTDLSELVPALTASGRLHP